MNNVKYIFYNLKKKLRYGFSNKAGRNFQGVICVHHRGGGNKICRLHIDFIRRLNVFGYVAKIQKLSLFTGFLGLIIYQNGVSSYSLLAEKVFLKDGIYCGTILMKDKEVESKGIGASIPLSYITLFSLISNVEYFPFIGGKLARAAGTSVILSARKNNVITLKLKSGWNMTVSIFCICMIGIISNSIHWYSRINKAGKSRSLGIRPTVRGVAMNPHDHPHGGGEGKKSPPAAARSPWGWLTKGTPSNRKKFQLKLKKLGKNLR